MSRGGRAATARRSAATDAERLVFFYFANCNIPLASDVEHNKTAEARFGSWSISEREIGILLPNNQRQHRTLHIQEDVLPYALR